MRAAAPRPASRAGRRLEELLDPGAGSATSWRSMACLSVAGGVIALGTVVLGLDREADRTMLTALAVAPIAVGALVLALAERLPPILMLPAHALALGLISAGIVASGEADAPYALFYIWIGVAAWFFLEPRQAVAMTVATAGLSAVVMWAVNDSDTDTASWWLVVAGSLLGISTFAGVMHTRSRRLIDSLADAAVRDSLTGLLNRRGYQQRLEIELVRARRYDAPLSIVLGDIDEFKVLNDRFGHRHGDEALRSFADVCQQHMRDVDFVSRVGGEEFAIVLPDTGVDGAVLAAERLRTAIRERLQTPDGKPLTASFGVATFPHHGTDGEVLLDRADRAMYAAKAAGRDRTVAYASEPPGGDGAAAHGGRPRHP